MIEKSRWPTFDKKSKIPAISDISKAQNNYLFILFYISFFYNAGLYGGMADFAQVGGIHRHVQATRVQVGSGCDAVGVGGPRGGRCRQAGAPKAAGAGYQEGQGHQCRQEVLAHVCCNTCHAGEFLCDLTLCPLPNIRF